MKSVKNTPLLDVHKEHGARVVEFAGFNMPLQYSGVVDEHNAVRGQVGLFDVSHMGQVEFLGPGAAEAADRVVTNNVLGLGDGQILYTPVCYEDGGIVDDCLVYRYGPERILIVVNAANIAKDFEWFRDQVGDRCEVRNRSDDYALVAVQGPQAVPLVASLAHGDLASMAPFTFRQTEIAGVPCTPSRTGYTGEDGFEIACAPEHAAGLWLRLLEAGAPRGAKPCGLGARDTLRLEARLCLYGNDIDETTTPLEAGLGWTVKLKAGEFVGRDALRRQKKDKVKRKLVCLQMRSRGIARHGHDIRASGGDGAMGDVVGTVTSGTMSPTLKVAIAMGYVPRELSAAGTQLVIDVRGKPVQAEVVKGPFYKRTP